MINDKENDNETRLMAEQELEDLKIKFDKSEKN